MSSKPQKRLAVQKHRKNAVSSTVKGSKGFSVVRVEMCWFCFDVLRRHLLGLRPPKPPDFAVGKYPMFVTWKLGRDRRLRGCIGTFTPVDLRSGLVTYTLKSALHDSRFPPITLSDMKRLHVSVSVLLAFEEGENYGDWTLGTHGIHIEFTDGQGHARTSTFLPEVAAEQGWTVTETVDHLITKSGFRGNVTPELRDSIKLTRYKTEKISASYDTAVRSFRRKTKK